MTDVSLSLYLFFNACVTLCLSLFHSLSLSLTLSFSLSLSLSLSQSLYLFLSLSLCFSLSFSLSLSLFLSLSLSLSLSLVLIFSLFPCSSFSSLFFSFLHPPSNSHRHSNGPSSMYGSSSLLSPVSRIWWDSSQ